MIDDDKDEKVGINFKKPTVFGEIDLTPLKLNSVDFKLKAWAAN